ncbi:hypothetical protein JQ633_00990 [Bradyrhizobium tropiciagri]|uniref:hypothetical protein n=1 Tax=Bradyrhizobium tropiciagri TaxID=312253 RepID=UPI001BA538F5|nr:hypothetical protein [Bradyrhizobium tropiciagri]MBR0868916.1 hypothetical protein [Bradyrhizobium tropiciagri]
MNDPKLQLISDSLFRAWFNLMCIASAHDGILPPLKDIAFTLRIAPTKAAQVLAQLHGAGLLDKTETGFTPHNWNGRQYKSDVSTPRVKRFRQRKGTVSSGVSETPPDTETETDVSEARASGASAPDDPRMRLFRDGLAKLSSMTGKGPDACRSFVGKCLKAAGDDAITVLGLIEEAERNRVVDPSAWIAARLKGAENGRPKNGITEAAKDLRERLASFDGPPRGADELRSGEGGTPVRLLSHG